MPYLRGAKAIIGAEERNNRKIFMAFNYRHIPYRPQHRLAEALIGTGVV